MLGLNSDTVSTQAAAAEISPALLWSAVLQSLTGCQTPPIMGNPVNARYLDRFLKNIKFFNLNVAGSGNAIAGQPAIGAVEKATRTVVNGTLQAAAQDALGIDYNADGHGNGFGPPSLLGTFAVPPYYHNGACETVACVLADVNHRTAGNTTDVLADPQVQQKVVRFVESIDATTASF